MPPPPLPQPATRHHTIDAMARMTLLVGVACLLYSVAQALLLGVLLPGEAIEDWLRRLALPLPPLLHWCATHAVALSWLSAALSLALCVASWALLRRRAWARLAFVAFLIVTAAANFAVLPLLWQVFDALQAWARQHAFDPQQLQHDLLLLRIAAMASGVLTALVFAALHGWLVYQLCRPALRAEFR